MPPTWPRWKRRCRATRPPGSATRPSSWRTSAIDHPAVIITAPRVIPARAGSGLLQPGFVRIAGGVITEVGQGPPPGRPDLALASGVLVPGLVDLQVNGYFGVELMAADPAGWAAVAAGLPATGCTAFLPTFVTAP